MINKGVKLTAGLLVAAVLVTTVPVEAFAGQNAESTAYITGTSYSFSAGAHSAIGDTVVLEDTTDNLLYAGVEENDAPVVAEPLESYENIAIADVKKYVNIRSEANAESEILGKLYTKGAATVLETLDGWYKVTSGSVTGYIASDYLIVGDEAVCKDASKRIGTVNTASLRLRKEATTESGVRALISEGSKLTVLDESLEGWYQVQFGSYTGYVSSDFVSVETVYTYAESKEEEAARKAAEAEARRREEARRNQYASSSSNASSNWTYIAPTGSGAGVSVVNYAVQFVGNPYRWGGTSLTNGADCSGFVMKVYEAFGVSLPHSSYKLRSVGYGVSAADVQPGDIICYSGHVAIYAGNGQIVHASTRNTGIIVSNNWQYKRVLAIRRIF